MSYKEKIKKINLLDQGIYQESDSLMSLKKGYLKINAVKCCLIQKIYTGILLISLNRCCVIASCRHLASTNFRISKPHYINNYAQLYEARVLSLFHKT